MFVPIDRCWLNGWTIICFVFALMMLPAVSCKLLKCIHLPLYPFPT